MKVSIQRVAWVALLLPLPLFAASTAQRELAAVLKAKPDIAHGAQLFVQCVSCHGADGGGETNGATPRIAGQHFRVLAKQIVDFRYGKRWDFRMEGQADRHHLAVAQDIADVAAYVSQLERSGKRGLGSGEFVADGSQIYAKNCQSCHGAAAEGSKEKGVPQLAGQHYAYLMRQMYDAVDGRRPALPRLHSERIEPLDFEQVRAVSDFLARIGWNSEAP
ncbi:MAG TPA: c-type cytochrome [Steroidobacteraceae bacterium]|nr:c-type cytochrome [Steroidobacteraceae bacterium]